MTSFISQNALYITIGLTAFSLVLLISVITLFSKINRTDRRLQRFLGKGSDRHDMELMLTRFLEKTERIGNQYEDLIARIQGLEHQMSFCIQKSGVVRFNPFKDMGGELSFAMALLDNRDNGVIISAIYGRDCCYTYCKSINEGKASHTLSPEEERAMMLALGENAPSPDITDELVK